MLYFMPNAQLSDCLYEANLEGCEETHYEIRTTKAMTTTPITSRLDESTLSVTTTNKLQSKDFGFGGENYCVMRDSVEDDDKRLYMESDGEWFHMNLQEYMEEGNMDTER